jgi:hypothetical protein
MPGGEGRVRCPRAKPHQLRTRAVRASCLPALRPVCEVRRWNWEGKPSHEAWPGSHQGTTHPLGRAVVERRQASAPVSGAGGASRFFRGATAPVRCGTDDSATAGVPLSFICRKRAAELFRNILNGPLWIGWLGFSRRSPSPQAGGGKHRGCLISPACQLARKYAPREREPLFPSRLAGEGGELRAFASNEPGEGVRPSRSPPHPPSLGFASARAPSPTSPPPDHVRA